MSINKKKVLIVEDDNDLREALKDKLFRSYEVIEAIDGEQAVSACLDHRPNLILLDLLLPKLEGIQVLERIRHYPDAEIAKIPVVVLSNVWTEKDILQIQGLKVDEYFVKAHTKIEDVIIKINKVLSGPKSEAKNPLDNPF